MSGLLADAKKIEPEILKIRRWVHQNPELSYHEKETAKLVARELEKLGIEVKTGVGGTGVLGILKGSKPGRVVALRADMDALPVDERSNVPFKSKVPGVMHACGHDTHVAMLLGTAMLLAKHRDELHGTVKFLFQPAEEHGGKGGAEPMIEDGVMENPKVDFVFGLHISNRVPSGTFGLRAGAFMAAPDSFKIKIVGRGGHGSAPQETVDPIFVAAQVINALQGVSSRMIDPVKPFVISVCSIHAGTKDNVIPDEAMLSGTIRTLDDRTRKRAIDKVRGTTNAVCRAFGASAEISFMEDAYPITYNDDRVTGVVFRLLGGIPGMKTREIEPVLGGEDFSRFMEKAPGTFYFLGTHNKAKGCVYPNHSSRFKADEDVLKYGAVSLAKLAMEFSRKKATR
ncbi:MAG: carboxypeptidase CpsA [Thaumarchaeota archaeon]|nr:carboxypeptidase CpsA [Nitrososphaerota archaeon]